MKVIIEVGSTNTKIDLFDGKEVKRLESVTIEFKRNFKKENKLKEDDVRILINKVLEYKEKYKDLYVCGTSIFRTLEESQKKEFLENFYNLTKIKFEIISQEKENELTVFGTVRNVNKKVAVFIGGGGSTEIAVYDNGIKEMINSSFGGIDVLNEFPDLSEDFARSKLEEVQNYVKKRLNLPKEKADYLILAGGGHKFFALESGISYEKNTIFEDELEPIMMNIETRKKDTEKYYETISLDAIRKRVKDPKWWDATRAMCAIVLNVAEAISAKYIIPTDITMVYGLLENKNWKD